MNSTGAMPKKINNLGQTAEDSDMFTNNWLSCKGLNAQELEVLGETKLNN